MSVADGRDRGRLERVRGWLRVVSREAVANGAHVADEGDRWFVAAARGLGKGAHRAEQSADLVMGLLFDRLDRLRPRWMRRRTPRERIERMLEIEAKRLDFDVTQEQFRPFAEKIAILLELVYTGVVGLDDIAFENAAKTKPESEPESDAGEQMPSHQQPDEGSERHAVDVQKDAAP